MKYLRPLIVGLVAVVAVFGQSPQEGQATFHFMRVHAIAGGVGGDANIQYVELRMTSSGQNFVGGHVIQFFDDSGALYATFTFPTNVTNSGPNTSILIGTQKFADNSTVAPDFIFTGNTAANQGGADTGHPVRSPAGKVVFDVTPVDSVAYGNGAYTGSVEFPPVNSNSLPISGVQALTIVPAEFCSPASLCGANNNTDYTLEPQAPRNNDGDTGGTDVDGDGVLNAGDLCPGTAPLAAVDGNGCSDAQVDSDADTICNPGAPSDGPSMCQLDPPDNCPDDANTLQEDFDLDGVGDVCDVDSDGDGVGDADETACGTDPLDPSVSPERLGNGVDDDGDLATDEVEAPVAGADCDGDGFKDDIEAGLTWPAQVGASAESGAQCDNVLNDDSGDDGVVNDGCPNAGDDGAGGGATSHQARCADTTSGNNEDDDQWPADFDDNGKLNLQDVNSFNVPVVHFGQLPLANHARWNLGGGTTINLQDVNALGGPLKPAMFNGAPAFGNTTFGLPGTCPAD